MATYTADNQHMSNKLDNEANKFALRSTLSRFADRSSIVGLPFIISAKSWFVRCVWILLFAGAIGFTIWQVVSNTTTYLSWTKKTLISLEYATLTFPMVTICNTNPVKRSRLHDASENLNEFLSSLNPETFIHNETLSLRKRKRRKKRFLDTHQQEQSFNKSFIPEEFDTYKEELGGEENPRNALIDEFKYLYGSQDEESKIEMGHHLDDMLLSCGFETRECDVENFTHFVSNKYGNCYSFNTNSTAKARRWGNENGLTLVLYLEVDEYISGLNLGYGIRVAISSPGKQAFPQEEGIFVSAGKETDIGVRMVNVTRLGPPHGVCQKNDFYKNDYNSDYSRQMCQSTCVARTIRMTCNCFEYSELRMYPIGTEQSSTECDTTEEYDCINDIRRRYIKGELQCDCPSPCQEITYDTQIASREWPSEEYLHMLVDAVCRDEIEDESVTGCNRLIEDSERHKRRNFLNLNVFYRDLNFQVMKEAPDYPYDKFFSDLGGSIGLGLGLSILGIFEIIHLIGEILQYLFYRISNSGKLKRTQVKQESKVYPEVTKDNNYIEAVLPNGQ